jgi:predicted nucleic acid-binding protein
MASKVRVFLDSSALYAGIISEAGGARVLLNLGEAGAVQLIASIQVIREVEAVTRKKAPKHLAAVASILDRARIEVAQLPDEESISASKMLTGHPGDAVILASALEQDVDYLVTLDKKHFLSNERLRESIPFAVGTPGDFLAFFRSKFSGYA